MSDYIFRGEPIEGLSAWVLLNSIKRVMEQAPDFTAQDIQVLDDIVKDFENRALKEA